MNTTCRDLFLNQAKKNKTVMKVFPTNGAMLTGIIEDFDEVGLVLGKCFLHYEKIISITPKE